MVDGWLSVVSLSVDGVLFKLVIRAVAVVVDSVDGWCRAVRSGVGGGIVDG